MYFGDCLTHFWSPQSHSNGYSGGYGGSYGGGYSGGHGSHGGNWGGYDDRMGNLGGGLRSIDWSSAKLERFEKNFYVEDKRISALSEREVEEFRRSKDIKVRAYLNHELFC